MDQFSKSKWTSFARIQCQLRKNTNQYVNNSRTFNPRGNNSNRSDQFDYNNRNNRNNTGNHRTPIGHRNPNGPNGRGNPGGPNN